MGAKRPFRVGLKTRLQFESLPGKFRKLTDNRTSMSSTPFALRYWGRSLVERDIGTVAVVQ